jgi:hypothetical protein
VSDRTSHFRINYFGESTLPFQILLTETSRILLAPDQRSPNDLVLIGASEMSLEPLQSLIVNERRKRAALCASPSMQLDRIASVIDIALKRW